MKRFLLTASLAATLAVRSLHAAEFPPEWQYYQPFKVSQPGPVQVAVPIETLDQTGLKSFRVFDAAGRPVPHFGDFLNAPARQWTAVAEIKSTLRGDETIVEVLTARAEPLAGVALDTPAPDFLKSMKIEGSDDGRTWTLVAAGEPVFRQFGTHRLEVPLANVSHTRLRLTLDNRRSPPIPITGVRVKPLAAAPLPMIPLTLTLVEREESGTQTRLTLRGPSTVIHVVNLRFEITDPVFTREVTLFNRSIKDGEVSEVRIGRGSVCRFPNDRGGVTEAVAIEASFFQTGVGESVAVIENGDSPPLTINAVTARYLPLYVTFHAPTAGTYYFVGGNPRAQAANYDISSLRGSLQPLRLHNPDVQPMAVNPAWRAPETLPGINPVGTAIDLAPWRYRKPLTLAAAGVQQLELDLDVLARAAKSFADLRLVRDGQQLPYLLDRTPLQRQFVPAVSRATDPKRPTSSLWELKLPQRDLPLTRLDCATTASLFQRSARVTEEQRDDRGNAHRVTLGTAEWVRTPGQTGTRLFIQLTPSPHTDRLRLEVENGDNPPLDLAEFTCWHPATRVLFKADTSAETFLYYGNPAANAARYDLSLVARQILAADKTRATLGAETVHMKIRGGEWTEPAGAGNWIFWAVLGVVVVVLLIVLAKLLPKPPPAN